MIIKINRKFKRIEAFILAFIMMFNMNIFSYGEEGDPINVPVITVSTITSDSGTEYAKVGDTVTLNIVTDIAVETPTVTIAGNSDRVIISGIGTSWEASLVLTEDDPEGVLGFTVNASTAEAVAASMVSSTNDDSTVTFDKTIPEISSVGTVAYGDVGEATATVSLGINDEGSAVSSIEMYDGVSWENIIPSGFVSGETGAQSSTVNFTETGTYKFRITDMAGNVSTESSDVVVSDGPETLIIKTLPTKLEYIIGEEIDVTNGEVTFGTTFGTTTDVYMDDPAVVISGFNSETERQVSIGVSYGGKSTNFTVNIVANVKYVTFATNGGSVAATASTSASTETLTNLTYLWSANAEDIGTKVYAPNQTIDDLYFTYLGRKITKNSVTGVEESSVANIEEWYYDAGVFKSSSYTKIAGKDQISQETIYIATEYPNDMGTLDFDYQVSSQKRFHTLNIWVNGTKVVNGVSGESGWISYQGKHQTDGSGEIEIVLEYLVSGGIVESGSNMASIRNLEFTATNAWTAFTSGETLSSPVLGPETYLYVKGRYDGRDITEVSEPFTAAVALQGIEIETVPTQTLYEKDDVLNLRGGMITLIYDCGRAKMDINDPDVTISGFDSSVYGVCEIFVEYGGFTTSYLVTVNTTSNQNTVANEPDLYGGMVPVKWNGTDAWIVTTPEDTNWYNYETDAKEWANVMLKDNLIVREVPDISTATIEELAGKEVLSEGSLFVWIPRYTYAVVNGKLATGKSISNAGTAKTLINWSDGTTDDTAADGFSATGYYKHPAFYYGEYNGGDPNLAESYTPGGTESTGLWVAKFEASNSEGMVAVKSNVNSWDNISVGDAFDRSEEMLYDSTNRAYYGITSSSVVSHLMKNSEWGAVALLANGYDVDQSGAVGVTPFINNYNVAGAKTGYAGSTRDKTVVTDATKVGKVESDIGKYTYMWNLTKGVTASTTGNVYGIYDLSGGLKEYVSSYIDNGDTVIDTNGSSLTAGASRVDIITNVASYTESIDVQAVANYDRMEDYKGFAVWETSNYDAFTSIDSDYAYIPCNVDGEGMSFWTRGGYYSDGVYAGIFNFEGSSGAADSFTGFRPIIAYEGEVEVITYEITDVAVSSSNAASGLAKVGDTITVQIQSNNSIEVKSVTIQGQEATIDGFGTDWTATYVLQGTEAEGFLAYEINFESYPGGVAQTPVSGTSGIKFDKTSGEVSLTPSTTENTNGAVIIAVNISNADGSPIVLKKWLQGIHTIEDFQSAGNVFTGNSFTVTQSGEYTVYMKDQAGNESIQTINITNIDTAGPQYSEVKIWSNNTAVNFAKQGDQITLQASFNKVVTKPSITILSRQIPSANIVTSDGGITWTATYVATGSDSEGIIPFTISNYVDNFGNEGNAIESFTTDGLSVTYDRTFVGMTLSAPEKIDDVICYTVTFSDTYLEEATIDLLTTDITLVTTGTATGTVAIAAGDTGYTKKVNITGASGTGTLSISINGATAINLNPAHIIAKDTAGNPAGNLTGNITSTSYSVGSSGGGGDPEVPEEITITAKVIYENIDCNGYITTDIGGNAVRITKTSSELVTTIVSGDDRIYYIYPQAGSVSDVWVDNVPKGALSEYTFSNITTSHEITVFFKPMSQINIRFSPNNGNVEETLSTKIIATGINEGTLKYILSTSQSLPNEVVTNYTSNSMYTFTGDWESASLTLGGDASPATVYRSKPSISVNSDSMAGIEMNSSVENAISFDYCISAASTSYLGISINGAATVSISGNGTWQNFSQTIAPADGKISIGLTYSKGSSAAGNDLAAIKNLMIGDGGWKDVVNNATITSTILGVDTYIHAKATSVLGQEVTAVSGSFKVSNPKFPRHSILSTSNIGGTISPLGLKKADNGSQKTYIITPDVGCHVGSFKVDGVETEVSNIYTSNNYQFNNITENHTIEVKFAKEPFALSFNANGGSGTMSDQTFVEGVAQNLAVNTFTKTGYTFAGWDTNSAGTTVVYVDGTDYTATADATLYGVWWADGDVSVYTLGTGVTGKLNRVSGVYAITGTGAMTNWASAAAVPHYSNRSLITSVMVGNSVTSIGAYALSYCSNLASIDIADSVTSIGDYAFRDCDILASIIIGNSVTSMGSGILRSCDQLTNVAIGDSVTSIGSVAFGGCAKLQSITVDSNNATYYSLDGVLYKTSPSTLVCYPVNKTGTSFTITADVVDSYAFADNAQITNISFNGTDIISNAAFWECTGITSITIPTTVTAIGASTFNNCYNLGTIIMAGRTSMAGVTLGGSWNGGGTWSQGVVGSDYVYARTYTTSFNANGGTGTMSGQSFTPGVAQNLTTNSFTKTGYTFAGWDTNSVGTTVVYADGASYTATSNATLYAVWWADGNVSTYTLGTGITGTLNTVSGVYTITGAGEITDWGSASATPYYSEIGLIKSVIIGDSITSIGNNAFEECSSLTSISIGDSVTSIGSNAFNACSSLTSIDIGNNVTSIGASAFYNCNNLTNIYGEYDVASIGDYTFYNCSSLTSIDIGDSVTSIGTAAFYNCGNLTSINIGDSVTSIGDSAFGACGSLTRITFINRTSTAGITLGTEWNSWYTWTQGIVGSDYVFSR